MYPAFKSWILESNLPTYLDTINDNIILLPYSGHYSFTVCLKSDSYLGVDVQEEIKLEVAEARQPIEEHPQWEFEDDEEEEDSKEEESDDEFATNSEADESDDE